MSATRITQGVQHYIQSDETIEKAKHAIAFYKTCDIPFKYRFAYFKFNEHYRKIGNGTPVGCWPNTHMIWQSAAQMGDKEFLKWSKKLSDKFESANEIFTPVFLFHVDNDGNHCKLSDRSNPAYQLKSPESIKYECDVDIIKNFIFTVKLKNGSKYGDFDHVLINNNGYWHLERAVSASVRCPSGDFFKPLKKDGLKKILHLMPSLGEQDRSQHKDNIDDIFIYPALIRHLIALAEAIPQTPVGKMYTDGLIKNHWILPPKV